MPASEIENPKQREPEIVKSEGKELGCLAGAENRTSGPSRGQAFGVVCMQVSEEVRLTVVGPLIY